MDGVHPELGVPNPEVADQSVDVDHVVLAQLGARFRSGKNGRELSRPHSGRHWGLPAPYPTPGAFTRPLPAPWGLPDLAALKNY